jgi:putative ABC transport system permease protein
MFEDFLNALQNFKMNKTRTLLSLLGIIIGVASVIIITTIGQSATANIKQSFGSSGLDLIQVNSGFMRRQSSTTVTFNEDYRDEIFENIDNIKTIYYKNSLSGTLRYAETDVTSSMNAIECGYLEMSGAELESGRWFTVSDNVQGLQKIILGSEIAAMLFPDGDALGKTITIDASRIMFGFEVVGILTDKTAGMESTANSVYIPRGFYAKKISPNPAASAMIIQATDQKYATKIVDDVEEYMLNKTGIENSVSIRSMQSIIEQFDEVMGTVSLLLSGVAAISLLVGGIGIMNIMIVTVTERRKEIGIRKALGATPIAIRSQFLVESSTITLFGGLVGIILGIAISAIVIYVLNWAFAVQWGAVVLAFFFSAFVGVFFGFNPAARAAKLDPVEALASE